MRCALVDAYSAGRYLAERLSARGFECVHVRSSPDVTPALLRTYRPDGIARDLGYAFDLESVARTLTDLGVDRVVPGTESGVETAEALAHALGLPTNGDRPSRLRRDKSLIANALRNAGLAAPEGAVVRTTEQAAAWAAARPAESVVVKPLDSGGSDHVFFCASLDDVPRAVEGVLGARTIYGDTNSTALVQERLFGTEYYVNTVSAGGRHRVIETWRYARLPGPGESLLYDYEEPVDHGDPETPELHRYVRAALDALGVRNGAAHTEVILTERGPVLLDCGARLCGTFLPHVIEGAIGFSQLSVLVDVVIDPRTLESFDEASWTWPRAFRNVFLISDRGGVAGELEIADELRELPSFAELALAVSPGGPVPVTIDLLTSPGFVYLSAPTSDELERDYRRIRELERGSPFVLPDPAREPALRR